MNKPLSRCVAIAALVMACGEKTTEPIPQATPPAALRVVFPDTVTRGQAFSLTVTAIDALGQTDGGWSGTVTLSASAGSITPTTANVSSGTTTIQATIGQHAGAVSITSSVGTATGSRSALVLSGQPAARLEVYPSTFMLPGAGATQALSVRAFDDVGLPTIAAVTWQSSRSGVAAVSTAGVATALTAGSSSITAHAGSIASDPAVALVTTPATGVLLVADEQMAGVLTPVNAQAPYGPGWEYRVRLTGPPPQLGQLLASRGEKPLAGRVTAVQQAGVGAVDVTLALVPLDDLLPGLSIDETIPLRLKKIPTSYSRARAPWAAIVEGEFNIGPFECESSLSQPNSNPFTLASVTRDVTPTLQAHIVHTDTHKRFVVQGGFIASLNVNPTLTGAINGSVECKAEVGDVPIPVGGVLAPFFGAQVTLGLGFEIEGGVTLATMGLNLEVSGGTTISTGYDCTPVCTYPFNITGSMSGNVKPDLPTPSSDFRVTAGVGAFAWADLQVGPPDYFPGSAALQLTLLESKAGVKQDFNLSSADVQSADAAYASTFSLAPYFSGGTTEELQQIVNSVLSLVGVSLSPFEYSVSGSVLATSPTGSFQIVPSRVKGSTASVPGDTATFIVDLSRTNYLTQYAVESVKLFRKPSASAPLVPAPGSCASIMPTTGTQSLFTCETDLPVSMAGEQTFYAFVKPILGVALPVLLEVSPDARSVVTVDDIVYLRDFTTGSTGPEWNSAPLKTSPSGQRFLGELGNSSTTLSLDSLPAHTQLELEFDIYIIDSWNGNGGQGTSADVIEVSVVGGPILKRTTFSNRTRDAQAFPGDYPGGVNPAGTGTLARDALGYPGSNDGFGDSSYRLRFTFNHTGDTIALRFASQQSSGQNERWGIDNVRVTVVP